MDSPNDVDAAYNWWGTTDPGRIEKYIYDKSEDETLGRVMFKPMMKTMVTGTVQ